MPLHHESCSCAVPARNQLQLTPANLGQFKSHLQGNLQRHKNLTRQSLCTGNFGCL